jgi:hypothetical protein
MIPELLVGLAAIGIPTFFMFMFLIAKARDEKCEGVR